MLTFNQRETSIRNKTKKFFVILAIFFEILNDLKRHSNIYENCCFKLNFEFILKQLFFVTFSLFYNYEVSTRYINIFSMINQRFHPQFSTI